MRVLYVEHDSFLARAYINAFVNEGFCVSHARHGEEGLLLAHRVCPRVFVVEPFLPDVSEDLFGILRRFRTQFSNTPIVLLTALSQRDDVEQGLQSGADVYCIKSHSRPTEVAKRLRELVC